MHINLIISLFPYPSLFLFSFRLFLFLKTMGWKIWQQNGNKLLIVPFHILTLTLLTLLLPLSFLLLSRLSIANYLLFSQTIPYTIPIFLFFQILPKILYILVSLMSSLTLIQVLTGQISIISRSQEPTFKLPLCISWLLLCIFQVCIGMGIEGSVAMGLNKSALSREISLISRIVFLLGLHETMTYWSRNVVKPVVDDTVLGFQQVEGWAERVAVAVGFGGVWWWRLRGEVEALVVMVEVKKELNLGVGVGDFIGWWLYYLTVTIGMVKFAKLFLWFAVVLLFKRVEPNPSIDSSTENEIYEKV